MRGCILEGSDGAVALASWLNGEPAPLTALERMPCGNRLTVQLDMALQRHGLALDTADRAKLRSAILYARRREATFAEIASRVPEILHSLPHMVGKNAVLAAMAYDEPWQRHCHDLDILIFENDGEMARALMQRAGFVFRADLAPQTVLEHDTGLPVVLHTRLWPEGPAVLESMDVTVFGRPCRSLPPEFLLLQIMILAASRRTGRNPLWVMDAARLLARHPTLDWDRVAAECANTPWSLLVALGLDYLATQMKASIPANALHAVWNSTQTASPAHIDVLLAAARTLSGGGRRLLCSTKGLRNRAALVRWLIGVRLVAAPP